MKRRLEGMEERKQKIHNISFQALSEWRMFPGVYCFL